MCQSKEQGGRRCDRKGNGSYYPVSVMEEELITENVINEPTNPAQALHLIALASQGHNVTSEIQEAARQFDITSLPKAQLWNTWSSLAESETPSAGLKLLHDLGFEEHFPELHAIRGVPQSEFWHPEGSVEKHIQEAGDVAARISREQNLSKDDTHVAVLGAICHDFGKSTHTQINEETGKITSYGHDKAGAPKARAFLNQIGASETAIKQIPVIVAEHMCHIQEPTLNSARKLHLRLTSKGTTLEAWTRVADSDIGGRGSASEPSLAKKWLDKRDEALAQENQKPADKSFINGKFLQSLGYQPGPEFAQMIRDSNHAVKTGEIADESSAREWFHRNYPL